MRILLFDARFRSAFSAVLALALLISILPLRIWKTSPPGFLPEIKTSALDLAQAWSLSRTARREMLQGRFREADFAWQTALANNPADANLVRGLIANLGNLPPGPEILRRGIGYSVWLLRLSATNEIDLDAVVRFLEQHRQFEAIDSLLRPFQSRLSPAQEIALAKVLFYKGDFQEFWQRASRLDPVVKSDLDWYLLAYQAKWTTGESRRLANERLEHAAKDPHTRTLVAQLQMWLAFRAGRPSEYARYLDALEKNGAASTLDHLRYWRLLAAANEADTARRCAQSFARQPGSPKELLEWAQLLDGLGDPALALKLLENQSPRFSDASQVWELRGSLLEKAEQWDAMRRLAWQMRSMENLRSSLRAYSYYLEGRADLADARWSAAERNFQQTAAAEIGPSPLALKLAARLSQLGYPQISRKLLQQHRDQLNASISYWQLCFQIAFELKEPSWLVESAEELFRRQPGNLIHLNNVAAALLLNRQQFDRAVQLTWQLVLQQPRSMIAVLNHSLALAGNHRGVEAAQWLCRIESSTLDPVARNSYHLARFECAWNAGDTEQAQTAYAQINPALLWPRQAEWLRSVWTPSTDRNAGSTSNEQVP